MLGISTIVELLLIILLLMILISLLWLFASGTINAISKAGTQSTQRTEDILSACMIVDSVYENNIYIKNCGNGVITNDSLNVYVDEVPIGFNLTPQTIGIGGTGTITASLWGLGEGDHYIKITNPNLQVVQGVEASLPDSCVLDLEFDEGSGTIAHDSSGNGNDGILGDGACAPGTEPCPSWVGGKFGKALMFDGVNDYVNVGNNTSLDMTTNDFTIELWAKSFGFSSAGSIISKQAWFEFNGPGYFISYPFNPQNIYGGVYDTKRHIINTGLGPTFDWANIAMIKNGTIIEMFVNGVEIGDGESVNDVTGSLSNIENLMIGKNLFLNQVFNGTIDSVRIYNQALTPDETLILKMK